MEVCAPKRVTEIAAAAWANLIARSSGMSSSKPVTNAPVEGITRSGCVRCFNAEPCNELARRFTYPNAFRAKCLIITVSMRFRVQSQSCLMSGCTVSHGNARQRTWPVSLIVITSTQASGESDNGRAGAGLRITCVPLSFAILPYSMPSIGVSSWVSGYLATANLL